MAELTWIVVPKAKVERYLLDVTHPVGGSKARFFIKHGFSPDRPEALAQALSDHLASELTQKSNAAREGEEFEKRLIVDGPMNAPNGVIEVRSIWQVDENSDRASFVTAYPRRRTSSAGS